MAGHPPFSADEPVVLISKHLVELPPPLPASITEKTAAIVFELLAKDPNLRIQSAADLIARIEDVHAEIGLGVTEPPPKPATHEDTLPVQSAQRAIAHDRRPSRALAAATLAVITTVAGAVALVAAKRSNQKPSTEPDDSVNGTTVAHESIGQRFPNTGATTQSRVEIAAPENRASAVPGSATVAPTPSSESEVMKATRAPAAKPARASTAAVRHSAAQKKISAPGRGKRYVVRRTIIRRTVITTSR